MPRPAPPPPDSSRPLSVHDEAAEVESGPATEAATGIATEAASEAATSVAAGAEEAGGHCVEGALGEGDEASITSTSPNK